jgi:hypothetical protein
MEFLSYRKFDNEAAALTFCEALQQHNVEYVCEKDVVTLDSVYGENGLLSGFHVKIQSQDFDYVNTLMEKQSQVKLEEVEKDYYLFEFSDTELMDVLRKRDEWSPFDFNLAKLILAKRGKEIDEKQIKELEKQRIAELSEPPESSYHWIIKGYLAAFLGGFFALIIGYILHTTKKTLPDGQRVYAFSEEDRKHGFWIFSIGAVVFIGLILKWLFLIAK